MTLGELKAYARRMADMEGSQFVSDAELTDYIRDSYAALYDMLVAKYEDYFVTDITFSITSGSTFTLPSNFYKLRGLDKQISGDKYQDVRQFMFSDRNRIDATSVLSDLSSVADVRYRLIDNKIKILPEDKAVGNYRLWYVPRRTQLVNDTDSTVNLLDFDEYIAIDAALKMLSKEETINQPLMIRKAEFEKRINSMAANRTTEPQKIQDVRRVLTHWDF